MVDLGLQKEFSQRKKSLSINREYEYEVQSYYCTITITIVTMYTQNGMGQKVVVVANCIWGKGLINLFTSTSQNTIPKH